MPCVKLFKPERFGDHRGYFAEKYNRCASTECGVAVKFVQANYWLSTEVGTVRGLHFHTPPSAQAKLVRGYALGFATLEAGSELINKFSDY
ncbi:dTDP-4-dehydrorhamnose 3,5-epimerase family protein [Sulfitobacter sp. 1A16787]|uniref:dTDP-4-dehydrorhamnose 3,5-epimerase family protein n=1 Tax=Sulfitobacter sp. 1A16787 TaxID=3368571 RepID=UPI003745E8D0